MIVILNKIDVITTYGKILYEEINKEVVMKKIVDRYTNNIFENIKKRSFIPTTKIQYLII